MLHLLTSELLPAAVVTHFVPMHGCSVATGAVYPAYATYKAVLAPKRPPPAGRNAAAAGPEAEAAREALLKYWALFGLTCLAERLLEQHIDRCVSVCVCIGGRSRGEAGGGRRVGGLVSAAR
jgi:hypothetical protein